MATTETTTLRVPAALRDRIAHIAEERGSTLVDVVAEAVDRLDRDRWWDGVHAALDGLSDADLDAYHAEAEGMAPASRDGLEG